jgi:hypothetical protein
VSLGVGAPAGAGAADDAPAPKRWEVTLAPYLWGTSVKGTVSADGASADIDVGLDDILRQLNLAAMGAIEVRYDRLLLGIDVVYASLSDDFDVGPASVGFGPATIQQGAIVLNVPAVQTVVGPVDVDTDLDEILLTLVGGYRILSRPLPWKGREEGDPRRLRLDAFLGARWWYVHTDLDVSMPPVQVPGFTIQPSVPAFPVLSLPGISVPGVTFGGLNGDFEDTVDWWDMLIGLRVGVDLSPRFDVVVAGDIGGFGIGSSSDFAWNTVISLGWHLSRHWALRIGYRALETDRDAVELLLHGPALAVTYRF